MPTIPKDGTSHNFLQFEADRAAGHFDQMSGITAVAVYANGQLIEAFNDASLAQQKYGTTGDGTQYVFIGLSSS